MTITKVIDTKFPIIDFLLSQFSKISNKVFANSLKYFIKEKNILTMSMFLKQIGPLRRDDATRKRHNYSN